MYNIYEEIIDQYPKDIPVCVLNMKNDLFNNFKSGIKEFYLEDLLKYLDHVEISDSQLRIVDDKDFNTTLILYFILNYFDNKSKTFLKNRDFINKEYQEISSNFRNIERIKYYYIKLLDSLKYDIREIQRDLNLTIEEQKEKAINLVKNSILDSNSFESFIYSSPQNFLEEVLPNISKSQQKFYDKLIEEEKKPLLEQSFFKIDLDIKFIGDFFLMLRFVTSYPKF